MQVLSLSVTLWHLLSLSVLNIPHCNWRSFCSTGTAEGRELSGTAEWQELSGTAEQQELQLVAKKRVVQTADKSY